MARRRLDDALVERGHYETRSRARDAILRGAIKVDGVAAAKPAQAIAAAAEVEIDDPAKAYVSRAALKLLHALDTFALSPRGLACLDVGASTGGFTQALLERGASHVIAIEVGHGQLHESLRGDPRICLLEGLNARDLSEAHLETRPQFVVCDVSFIPLAIALAPALSLAEPGAKLVALIKPQFEAGRDALDGKGIVRDAGIHDAVCGTIASWLQGQNWRVIGTAQSPVEGGDGNREFLIAAEKPC
jgi:23S rRNA (cytidine1920-2'-O)/16S rRNA (cytidine1409-2'-O)-methyltransferase